MFIEFNGIQHYEPKTFGGITKERALQNFKLQQERDKLKDDFCKDNHYPLLWIPYWDFDNIEKIIYIFIEINGKI